MSLDVAAFQPSGLQALATEASSGSTVAGMPKLAQRFVLELMTGKNEIAFSVQGCDFVARMLAGVSSETDVFIAFHSALADVANRLRAAELTTDPDDERLLGVGVLNLALSPGSLNLNLQLRNRTGQTQQVSLPLHFILN